MRRSRNNLSFEQKRQFSLPKMTRIQESVLRHAKVAEAVYSFSNFAFSLSSSNSGSESSW